MFSTVQFTDDELRISRENTYLGELDLLATKGSEGKVSDLELVGWSRHDCGKWVIWK